VAGQSGCHSRAMDQGSTTPIVLWTRECLHNTPVELVQLNGQKFRKVPTDDNERLVFGALIDDDPMEQTTNFFYPAA